jgi:hypothetical protein
VLPSLSSTGGIRSIPMKTWGPVSEPMKGIVAPSTASRRRSIAAAPPVRRALPATPPAAAVSVGGRSLYIGRRCSARALTRA